MTEAVRCGSGEGCAVRLPRRGLCDRHRAALAAVREDFNAPRKRPAERPLAPVTVTHLPGHEAKPAPPPRLPVEHRATLLAQAVHEAGRLTREEAVEAAGLTTAGGSFVRVLSYARDRGWVRSVRGSGGGIVAGEVAPT